MCCARMLFVFIFNVLMGGRTPHTTRFVASVHVVATSLYIFLKAIELLTMIDVGALLNTLTFHDFSFIFHICEEELPIFRNHSFRQ